MATTKPIDAGAKMNGSAAPPSPKPSRPPRKDYASIHARPLPLTISPLPAFHPNNPISLLRVAWALIAPYLFSAPSHSENTVTGYFSSVTNSIHITDPAAVRMLWECGFFGKGSLSRSEPEWLERQRKRVREVKQNATTKAGKAAKGNLTAAEVTAKRREERRLEKRERARLEAEELERQLEKEGKVVVKDLEVAVSETAEGEKPSENIQLLQPEPAIPVSGADTYPAEPAAFDIAQQEHLQLTACEAFFLSYALGILKVTPSASVTTPLSNLELLALLRRTSVFPPLSSLAPPPPNDPFLLNYVAYHHYRSLGWVVRSGIKFGCDFLLYQRGPAFSHAEFAVLLIPAAPGGGRAKGLSRDKSEWWWLHAANRVQNQVRKSLVLTYVEICDDHLKWDEGAGDIGALIKSFRIRDFVIKRWSPNRNRD